MDYAPRYRLTRDRLITLGRSLEDSQAASPVPGCPAWTVKDVYAHLAGIIDDVSNGRLEGITTDPWTQRQVEARAAMTFAEVLDEWESYDTELDAVASGAQELGQPNLLIDLWTHGQDIRGAVGAPAEGDDTFTLWCATQLAPVLVRRAAKAGLGPAELRLADQVHREGEHPAVVLTVDPFEYVRGSMGRRSRAQMRAWDWAWSGPEGDPDPYIDCLTIFGIAESDIVESP